MTFIGKVGEVSPGSLLLVEVDGENVVIANVDGQLFAIGDTCTHRGCSLSEGELSGTVITCRCHGGKFDVTSGEVVGGPPSESETAFPVQVVGDEFRIG